MKHLLFAPLVSMLLAFVMPNHYKTVKFAYSSRGNRLILLPERKLSVEVYIDTGEIAIGKQYYKIRDRIVVNDSLYAYRCYDDHNQECAVSVARNYGESTKYRILVVWNDSIYSYKAN